MIQNAAFIFTFRLSLRPEHPQHRLRAHVLHPCHVLRPPQKPQALRAHRRQTEAGPAHHLAVGTTFAEAADGDRKVRRFGPRAVGRGFDRYDQRTERNHRPTVLSALSEEQVQRRARDDAHREPEPELQRVGALER